MRQSPRCRIIVSPNLIFNSPASDMQALREYLSSQFTGVSICKETTTVRQKLSDSVYIFVLS